MTRLVAVVLVLAASSACSSPGETLVVGAAASLTESFTEIAGQFEATTGLVVELNFAGSSTLREQILEGAPFDVFASANLEVMQELVDDGVVNEYAVFATNALVIAVPDGNPAAVTGLNDFSRDELLLGLCAEPVPCGTFARDTLARAGVEPVLDTEEPDVRALLTKIAAGELDAGIVYRTDVAAADVDTVEIPDSFNVDARYAIATIDVSSQPAADFVEFVRSDEGLSVLRTQGFGTP